MELIIGILIGFGLGNIFYFSIKKYIFLKQLIYSYKNDNNKYFKNNKITTFKSV